jgi:hypothetical protein
VIRPTVEKDPGPVCPPPNHAAVFSGGGGASVMKLIPPEKEIPLVNVIAII